MDQFVRFFAKFFVIFKFRYTFDLSMWMLIPVQVFAYGALLLVRTPALSCLVYPANHLLSPELFKSSIQVIQSFHTLIKQPGPPINLRMFWHRLPRIFSLLLQVLQPLLLGLLHFKLLDLLQLVVQILLLSFPFLNRGLCSLLICEMRGRFFKIVILFFQMADVISMNLGVEFLILHQFWSQQLLRAVNECLSFLKVDVPLRWDEPIHQFFVIH